MTYALLHFDCRDECTWTVPAGTAIELLAVPASGEVFVGWAGDCAVLPNPCTAAFADGDAATAAFAPHALRLELIGGGDGAFNIDGGGIGTVCTASCAVGLGMPPKLAVTYDAQGSIGTAVGAWSGDCLYESPSNCSSTPWAPRSSPRPGTANRGPWTTPTPRRVAPHWSSTHRGSWPTTPPPTT